MGATLTAAPQSVLDPTRVYTLRALGYEHRRRRVRIHNISFLGGLVPPFG